MQRNTCQRSLNRRRRYEIKKAGVMNDESVWEGEIPREIVNKASETVGVEVEIQIKRRCKIER